jgi:hypothetical protein
MIRIFAFGTLKKGFPLHDEGLAHAVYCGVYRTVLCDPMLVADRWFAPMMFDEAPVATRYQGVWLCARVQFATHGRANARHFAFVYSDVASVLSFD